jgi:hypothetical protein
MLAAGGRGGHAGLAVTDPGMPPPPPTQHSYITLPCSYHDCPLTNPLHMLSYPTLSDTAGIITTSVAAGVAAGVAGLSAVGCSVAEPDGRRLCESPRRHCRLAR